MHYENRVFERETVKLDGNSFTRCTFREAVVVYSGGELTMANCAFESFSIKVEGDFARGLDNLHQLFGTDAVLTIIRGILTPPNERQVLAI